MVAVVLVVVLPLPGGGECDALPENCPHLAFLEFTANELKEKSERT